MKKQLPEFGETHGSPWVLMASCLEGSDCCDHRATVEDIANALVKSPHLMTELQSLYARKIEATYA